MVKKNIKLCKPSLYYLILSLLGLFLTITFNIMTGMSCSLQDNLFLFSVQIIYILFWSWVLNFICKKGYSFVSWGLFLAPIISGITFTFIVLKKV